MGLISALAALVVSAFYGPAPNEPPVALVPFDRPYVITSLTTSSGHGVIRDGSEVEIWFDRHKSRAGGTLHSMGWNAHCNSFGGRVRIRARRLIPKGTVGTLLGCETPAEQEDAWLGYFFDARPAWSVGGGRLILRTRFATMRLTPGRAPPGPP